MFGFTSLTVVVAAALLLLLVVAVPFSLSSSFVDTQFFFSVELASHPNCIVVCFVCSNIQQEWRRVKKKWKDNTGMGGGVNDEK